MNTRPNLSLVSLPNPLDDFIVVGKCHVNSARQNKKISRIAWESRRTLLNNNLGRAPTMVGNQPILAAAYSNPSLFFSMLLHSPSFVSPSIITTSSFIANSDHQFTLNESNNLKKFPKVSNKFYYHTNLSI